MGMWERKGESKGRGLKGEERRGKTEEPTLPMKKIVTVPPYIMFGTEHWRVS